MTIFEKETLILVEPIDKGISIIIILYSMLTLFHFTV